MLLETIEPTHVANREKGPNCIIETDVKRNTILLLSYSPTVGTERQQQRKAPAGTESNNQQQSRHQAPKERNEY